MERLIAILERYADMEYLIAEIKACDQEIETVEELTDYLEDELAYAN